MTHLDRQVSVAQHRLWLNRWMHAVSVCLAVALIALALVLLIERSYDLGWPTRWIALTLAGLGIGASVVWTAIAREGRDTAAVQLDQAAGLRERLSSARHCRSDADPFARAVLADAERISASVTARRHIRLSVPRPLPWTVSSGAVVGLMFLVTPGWLKPVEESRAEQVAVRLEQTRNDVEKHLEPLRRLAEANPILEEYQEEIDGLDKQSGGRLRRPGDLRHEAVKKIDSLADTVRRRREHEKFKTVRAMRKVMRRISSSEAPTDKLARALAKGDFKAANEEIDKIKEQLATLKSEQDSETVKKLSEQLARLAKQIEQAAADDRLAAAMKKAGLSEEEAKRMLESLSKKDMDQLKQELADKGLTEKQIQKLAQQLKQHGEASEMAKQLAKKLGQAAEAAACGAAGEAMSGLSQAGAQLSELEQLEQEMGQLDSALAALENAKGDVGSNPGEGSGQGGDQPGRGGMGPNGQGRGGRAREEKTDVGFKTERGKVHVGKGGITGEFLVDGAQVPGEIGTSVSEVVSAAERDASDRIKRDRIPRQYQTAVKAYFSNVRRSIGSIEPQPVPQDDTESSDDDTAPSTDNE